MADPQRQVQKELTFPNLSRPEWILLPRISGRLLAGRPGNTGAATLEFLNLGLRTLTGNVMVRSCLSLNAFMMFFLTGRHTVSLKEY